MPKFVKLADYITELSDHDLDYIWEDSGDDFGNPDYSKVYRNINRLMGRVQDIAYDPYDETAESVDKPTKVHDIVMHLWDKDPMTWYQWRQQARQALQDKNTKQLDELTQPVSLYVKTDKPGIASDGWTTWDADTLEKSVNTAYGGNPTKELASLLAEYRKRYTAYRDAEKAEEAAQKKINDLSGITKSAAIKRADYIDSIPYYDYNKLQRAAEDAEPEVPWDDDKAWDARQERVDRAYSQAAVKYVAKLVKRIKAGDYSGGEYGTGVAEKGKNPEIYIPMLNDDTLNWDPVTYEDWKAMAEKALTDQKYDRRPYGSQIAGMPDQVFVKTDGKRLGIAPFTDRDMIKQVYSGNVPKPVSDTLSAIDAAEAEKDKAAQNTSKAREFMEKLLRRPE